jgi:4-cresol dehydrogenase (hydroxylating)
MTADPKRKRVLPPGVSSHEFDQALRSFAAAIGEQWVIGAEEGLAEYRDPFAFASEDAAEFASSAVVKPSSVEEIQAILRIATQRKTPLWTISKGKNLGYGGPAPRVAGSVILDLGRMNRIIEVNEEFCYALIEPGVSFFDLYEYIREKKLKLWISVPALGWGSVVGNALDRGIGYTPYGDHSANICGMEVVLANGEVIRTGMGAMSQGKTWQAFQPGYGPSVDGLFMQSNMGVVTKAGMWLMPEPEIFIPCDVRFESEADLAPLVEITAGLRREGIIQNTAVVSNAVRLLCRKGSRSKWYNGDGAMPQDVVQKMLKESGLGSWNLTFAIYGHEELADARLKIIEKAFSAIPAAKMSTKKWNVKLVGREALAASLGSEGVEAGIPALMALEVLKYRGEDGGHIGFSPILAPSGKEAVKLASLVGARCHEHGFDYYGGFSFGARHLYSVMMILYDKRNDDHRVQAHRLCQKLVVEAGGLGYGEYRAHVAYMDLIGEQYDFNHHALRRFTETLKDAADPNGILSPGKQGIWPSSMRPV